MSGVMGVEVNTARVWARADEYELSLLIFFFKQKTAYEITYGDWSPDVCSSDVHERAGHHDADVPLHAAPCDRAGDDTIVVGGIALRFGDSLATTDRAAVEVRVLRRDSVITVGDRLRLHRHLVHSAIRDVREFLRMSERERGGVADMASVGARCRVAGGECCRHGGIRDRAGPPTVSYGLELSIPYCAVREPHFDLDIGVARRRQRRLHT